MISIPNVMPITPHSGAKLLEHPKHCWVIYPFNTEEDEFEEIKDFLTSLAEFFYQSSGFANDLAKTMDCSRESLIKDVAWGPWTCHIQQINLHMVN